MNPGKAFKMADVREMYVRETFLQEAFITVGEIRTQTALRPCYRGQLATTIFCATPYNGKSIPV